MTLLIRLPISDPKSFSDIARSLAAAMSELVARFDKEPSVGDGAVLVVDGVERGNWRIEP